MADAAALALDLGSSGIRAHLGRFDGEKLSLVPVLERRNGPVRVGRRWYWEALHLHATILEALQEASKQTGGRPFTLGIDTWGVDFGLVDASGELMAPVYHYRDPRTQGLWDEVFERVPEDLLYERTGIPSMPINTLVQLYWTTTRRPWLVEKAAALLLTPDLLNYFLTGEKRSELTIASTSQLLDAWHDEWARELIRALGFPDHIFPPVVRPGHWSAPLRADTQTDMGLPDGITVIGVASHDTASAVAATPLDGKGRVFLSAGSWSLLGMELDGPICTGASRAAGFSNERGVDGMVLYHRVLPGLWLLQESRREWISVHGRSISYEEIHAAAAQVHPLNHLFDPEDPSFLNPPRMASEIVTWFQRRGLAAPRDMGEVARAVYDSLALDYRRTIEELEHLTGQRVEAIHLVGGGARAPLFCQAVADATGRRVIAGPATATAVGNILVQLIARGELDDLRQGRALIRESFRLQVYEGTQTPRWDETYHRWYGQRG